MSKTIEHYRNGILIKKSIYKNDKKIKSIEFNDQKTKRLRLNRFIKGISIHIESLFDDVGNLEYFYVTLEKNGKKLKLKTYHKNLDNLVYLEEYHYDNSSNLLTLKKGIPNDLAVSSFNYDSNGNILSKINTEKDNNHLKSQFWTYDKYNNKITYKKYNKEGFLVKFELNKYDSHNRIIESIFLKAYEDNYTLHKKNNYYNFNENAKELNQILKLTEVFYTKLNGAKIEFDLDLSFFDNLTTYYYDNQGNLINITTFKYRSDFSKDHLTLWNQELWEYDERGQIIYESEHETHTDWDDYSESYYEYFYDNLNRLTQKNCKRENQSIYLTEFFSYYKNGILKTHKITSDILGKEIKKFDKKGNLIYSKDSHDTDEYKIYYT